MAIFKRKRDEVFVEDNDNDYLSISETYVQNGEENEKDFNVRVFVLDDYENIRDILDVIRGEKTLCIIDIHLLRNKDPDELKRAVEKIKKTVNAIEGDIVAFHENWILTVPKNIEIHKNKN